MDRIRYKDGVIWCGDNRASGQQEMLIACLSAYTGNSKKETCDLLNRLLQSLDLILEKIRNLAEEVRKIIGEDKSDICESCEDRRTKHGSSCKKKIERQAKANIKWREKYRPP